MHKGDNPKMLQTLVKKDVDAFLEVILPFLESGPGTEQLCPESRGKGAEARGAEAEADGAGEQGP